MVLQSEFHDLTLVLNRCDALSDIKIFHNKVIPHFAQFNPRAISSRTIMNAKIPTSFKLHNAAKFERTLCNRGSIDCNKWSRNER